VITSGSLIARLVLHQTNNFGDSASYVWSIYANNDVVVPTGGCDVSSRDVTVTLPNYPGTQTIPLTVHCAATKALSYYLSGTTTDTASTIFTNTSSTSPAQGVGVQLSNSSGVLATNQNVSLGNVGTSPVSLGLTASYARTSGQVVAGNVQSIVGVTFVYQ
uniref:fimbrial protein n=1 Tax=Tatumella sp. UBA2305 TaxID=1947647 RepID=UPI0025EC9859